MALSPMMVHYRQVKQKYSDCIIFYRLGDFYEMFDDDAVKASEILNLTLTGRDCGLPERAPMCGVPYHAADLYISKLVAAGEKVAICEQLTEPDGRNLVEREVVKIVTAGTLTNNELIDEKTNNFICSAFLTENNAAIAWADITTGEFFVKSFVAGDFLSDLFNELVKIAPAEIIANREAEETLKDSPLVKQRVLPKPSAYTESEFDVYLACSALKQQFKVLNLQAFGIKDDDLCVRPAGALVSYLKETQKSGLTNINGLKLKRDGEFMMLDFNAVRNLELVKTLRDGKKYGSLLWVLDKTKTGMGARKLQSVILSPLNDKDKINYRLDAVESLYNNNSVRESVSDLLSAVKDVGRITGNISNGNLAPKDCVALATSLEVLPTLKFQLSGFSCACISDILSKLGDFGEIVQLLNDAVADEPSEKDKKSAAYKYIKKGFNKELDELRSLYTDSRSKIAEIESRERDRTGIKTLRIGYNRVFGYYIEVTNSFKEKVPYDYIRRQTLTNAERYVTEELKSLEEKILSAEDKAAELELGIFNGIKQLLLKDVPAFLQAADAIAELDMLISFATVAKRNGYIRPVIVGEKEPLRITDGRHPVVEVVSSQRFIPNDCTLDCSENRTMVITGPNMAGKSTYMRQVALIALMAHIGSFVPARSAEIPLIDRIFTRIGASDSLISDQSTFMVEMSEVASIIKNATCRSLLVLDEIGRGTSTFDGLSIAWAVVEHVTENIKAKTLFATHYHELTELEGVMDGVKNYKISVKETADGIIFLRKIMRGGANRSFGIEVAELAGVDKKVTERAKAILKTIEKSEKRSDDNNAKNDEITTQTLSETERILKDLNPEEISPMQALNILADLCEKVKDR
ncbi:MAG: DNA mismatch repair protein MutS [Candidatus Borkfalkiaceae bacterium]|nr:DNA mismatch repair protein MutS [Christensenellaceae bacterium]